ncbi:DMT family transporter [Allorhizobium sp. BGMRC 0089]|uniref:DMT family transporter n=1 Tax=Allorhizobium sonneratiae TaxID=2934936 RepID=UPI00203494E7|nr:DMT family transporter [Allorhizobium sonneratiae]MCM2292039.1 DMT family transporter [Allorhizobium sonneratiae]
MAYLSLALAAVFWGGNYVVGKLMVGKVDPILLSELRWSLTSCLLLIFNFRSLKQALPIIRKSKKTIIALGVLGQVLFPVTLYVGLQYTSPLNAAIYLSATPSIVLSLNWIFFKDYISKSNILGVIISTLGVVWLVTQGDVTNLRFLENINIGDFWTMVSAVSWGTYCSFLRTKPKDLKGNVFVTVCAIVGAVVLMPFCFVAAQNGAAMELKLEWGTLIGLSYLVIFPSWLSYLLWSKGIAEIGATRGEIFTHFIPLSAGLLSITFLGVRLENYHIVSVIGIVIGVYLCSKHDHRATVIKNLSNSPAKQS